MKLAKNPALSLLLAFLMVLTSFADGANAAAGYPNPGRDSTNTAYVEGAYIIDSGAVSAGATKQTAGQGLKPYGLVYALLKAKVEVDWVINSSKVAIDQTLGNAGTDFTFDCDGSGTAYASKNYRTGAFVIPKEFAAQAKPIIDSWKANSANAGLVVDGPCAAPIPSLPIFSKISSWPRTSLDAQNGAVAVTYYTNAGIPQGSLTDAQNPPAYRFAAPSQLTTCDDLYVMPHADPTYATHKELKTFVLNGGSFYASCHAVSVVENMEYPTGTKYMNFLTSNGLINYDAHSQGTAPYNFFKPGTETQVFKGSNDGSTFSNLETVRSGDPIAQFLGVTTAATQAGSEQIFIPKVGSFWRPTTQIIQYDPSQANSTASQGANGVNGPAASLLYGPAFGDTTGTNGYVMYQGGHSVAKGSVDDVAAQRAFFNMVLLTAVDRRPAGSTNRSRSPIVQVTEPAAGVTISGGSSIPVSGTATGGSGSYTNKWTAACFDQAGAAISGGTFADDTAASTTFTAPVVAGKVNCNMTLTVIDTCGRFSFGVQSVVFSPDANLVLTKTVNASSSSVGGQLTYTLLLKNTGKINNTADGAIHTAQDVKLSDPLPSGLTFVSVSDPVYSGTAPAGAHCTAAGSLIECDLKSLLDEQTVTVTIQATVNSDQSNATIVNTASASSSSADSNPSSNTSSASTTISSDGIRVVVTRSPSLVDSSGQSVTYTYTVTNIGNSSLDRVTVIDKNGTPSDTSDDITLSSPSGDNGTAGVLETSDTWVYTSSRTVSSASNDDDNDGKTTTKRTTAVASAYKVGGSTLISSTGEVSVQVVTPSLLVTKTADSTKIKANGIANFSLSVKNTSNGPATMSNITVTDSYNIGGTLACKVLGANITLTDGGTVSGRRIFTYTIPSLETGAEWDARCSITGVTTAGTNILSASATNPLKNTNTVNSTGNGTVTITIGAPDLVTSKTASSGSVRIGDQFYYTVSATNTTVGTAMTNVKLVDQIPSSLRVDKVTRNYVSTSGATAGTTGVVAWDKFYNSSSGGSGWLGSSWSFGSSASINSSSKVQMSLQTSSNSTTYMERTVTLGTTSYPQLHINIECQTDNSTAIVPVVTLTPSSGSAITVAPNSGQSCNTSSTNKGINYKVNSSLISSSAITYTLRITAPTVSSTGKKLYVDDVVINCGQIAMDPTNSSTDGLGFNNDWKLTAGSNSSSKFKFSSGQLYVDASSNNTYSGTATRNLTITPDEYNNVKLTFQCRHSSFSNNDDLLEIKVNGRSVFKEDKNTSSSACSSSSSSGSFVSPIAITETGDVQITITMSSRNVKQYLSDIVITGQKTSAVSASTTDLTISALQDSNDAAVGTPGYSLAAGQRVEFIIYVTVLSLPTESAEIVNTASSTSDQQSDPSSASAAVVVLSAGFSIAKTVSSSPILTGTAVTYTYVVANTGNTSIQGIVVSDSNGGSTINVLTNAAPSSQPETSSVTGTGVAITRNAVDNGDWILDPEEVWTLTVSSGNLSANTTGTATLNGYEQVEVDDGNGNITITPTALNPATSVATVAVIAPGLTVNTTATGAQSSPYRSSKIYTSRTVTYTYSVTNTGTGGNGIKNVGIVAANCPMVVLQSGDANNNEILESGETWIFTCTTVPLTTSQTNQSVVAKGLDNTLGSAVESNSQTVNVTVYDPGAVSLTRTITNATNSTTSTLVSGVAKLQASRTNALTFNYQITNTGTTTVSAAVGYAGAIVDDNCATISYVSGDTSTDRNLDANETWVFKCDLDANQPMRLLSSATAYVTDATGGSVQSSPKKADLEILAPSLITKITADTEYVKYGLSDRFTYSVENNGGTKITSFSVADDSCAPLVRSSVTAATGYTANTDNVIDIGEIWNYTCTRSNYTADHMSTFEVTGVTDELGYSGYTPDPANALVFVIDPTMTVTQQATVYGPTTFINKANPGTATQGPATTVNANVNDVIVYTYSISSTATTRGSSVAGLNAMLVNSITDSRCTPIEPIDLNADSYNDGDSNSNGQLDPGETWQFNCSTVQVTAAPAVVDAQASVEAATVANSFVIRPASVRVIVAGASPSSQPAPGGVDLFTPTPSPTATPTPGASQTPTPQAPKVLNLKVYFKGDSAVLTATAKADLRILAKKAKTYGLASLVNVIGRVKETNDKSYDIRLSRQRATNVTNYLKSLGVKGTYRLVAAGISPENKPVSRRVDVTITWSAK